MFQTVLSKCIPAARHNWACLQHVKNYSTKIDFEKLVKNNKVVVFMKGEPESPRCGFSNAVVQILRMHNVNYDSHDVLKDDNLRDGKL